MADQALRHRYDLLEKEPALKRLALIVRGADTDQRDLTPESRGLLAVAQGFSLAFDDDQQQLAAELPVYDALFAWCRQLVQTISDCPEGSGVLCAQHDDALVFAAATLLPGRPRWCVFDRARDRFLVNSREPACVVARSGGTGAAEAQIQVSAAGPHGLELDPSADRAFAHTTAFDNERQQL